MRKPFSFRSNGDHLRLLLLLRRTLSSHHSLSSDSLHHLVADLQLSTRRRRTIRLRQTHARLLATGLHSSPFAVTSLISAYSKLSRPADALSVFLTAADVPNLFAWNAIIAGLASNSFPSEALDLFERLRIESPFTPDAFTFPCAINAFCDLGDHLGFRKIHADIVKLGLAADVFAASAAIRAYLKFGRVGDAEKIFNELTDRDVVLWNAMITGFAQLGHFDRAFSFYRRMVGDGLIAPSKFTITGILSVSTAAGELLSGMAIHGLVFKLGFESDVAVSNSLIDLYGKCESNEDASKMFFSMPERDLFSWNSIISAYATGGDHAGALSLVRCMWSSGVFPDAVTVAAVLSACSHVAALSHGREIHARILRCRLGSAGAFVENALMDMYAKSGVLADARKVFDEMPCRDVASWNILIAACAAHGQGNEAVGLLEKMKSSGVDPDEVTFVAVMTGCSHAGMVEVGREMMRKMKIEFGLTPEVEHHVCVVDMLGRAGMLEEARKAAEESGYTAAWRAYLAACGEAEEAERAVEAGNRVVEMEPSGSGGYVLLANAYGRMGKYCEVAEVRSEMRKRSVRKEAGCSWVEFPGLAVMAFATGEVDLPEAEKMEEVLRGMLGALGSCDMAQ